jgi:hypothetical protein
MCWVWVVGFPWYAVARGVYFSVICCQEELVGMSSVLTMRWRRLWIVWLDTFWFGFASCLVWRSRSWSCLQGWWSLHRFWFFRWLGCWFWFVVFPRLVLRGLAQLSDAGVQVLLVCSAQLSGAGVRGLGVGSEQLSDAALQALFLVRISDSAFRALTVLGLEKLSGAPLSGKCW